MSKVTPALCETDTVPRMRFEAAVIEAQDWFGARFASAPRDIVDALLNTEIREQARAVDECAARFSRAELEGTALGRYGPMKFFPALGDMEAKKVNSASRAQRDAIGQAVGLGLAVGYTFMAAMSEDVSLDPTHAPEEIWNVWVPNLNSGMIERTALSDDMVSDVRDMGSSAFRQRALNLGLGGFGKKARLGHIGAFYAQSGALLRAIQVHDGGLSPDPANIWPYADYAG